MVRQATETAVSASISTPVLPRTRTVAETRRPGSASSGSISTATLVSSSGWQSGISSCAFLAAIMPAMRAVASTSPFLALPAWMAANVPACIRTDPSATATRSVSAFAPTSTMCASPELPIWVSRPAMISDGGAHPRRATLQQGPRRGLHVGLAHQAFADEEGGDAGAGEALAVVMGEDAAFADQQPVVGHLLRQFLGGLQRRLEGAQVAVVDADQRRGEPQCTLQLGRV